MNKSVKTFWYYYEKSRTLFLVLLMVLCIVQVGILWSRQSGSLPFLSAFFKDSKISQASLEDSKEDYLLPYRVVMSTGYDGDHYIIPKGSKDYQTLWNGAKQYLAQALNSRPKRTLAFSEDAWGSLAANKPYYFEFKTHIPVDIIRWVLNLSTASNEGLTSIYKMVICPDDPDNGYYDTVYIRDDKNIYTYDVDDFKSNILGSAEIKTIYTKYTNQQENSDSKNYQLSFEKLKPTAIRKDMFIPLTSNSTQEYPNLNCIPFADGQSSGFSEYTEIAKGLFGEARNDFDPDEDVYGSVVFKKADSVYRLYKNSILEYRYTENQSTPDKTTLLDAFKNAAGFIMEQSAQGSFMNNINVYLASVEEGNNSYIFNFDFAISLGGDKGEIPLLLKNYTVPNGGGPLEHGISIEATSKRVIRFEWLALMLRADKTLKTYSWNYGGLLEKISNTYPEFKEETEAVRDCGIYYVLEESLAHDSGIDISPGLVLLAGQKSYDVTLEGK